MPKSLNTRSGLAIVGTAVGPDGHRFEVLQVGQRLRILNPETDHSIDSKSYKSWDELRKDWPGAMKLGAVGTS